MKALKIVGIVVGVVALTATGLGLALAPSAAAVAAGGAAAAGGIAGVASAATLASIGAIASVAAGVIGVATALLAPKPSFNSQGNPLSFQTNPQSGLPYCVGRTRMSGVRIHADTYDAPAYKSESKQDVLAFAALLSIGGEIEGIEKFRADKEEVTFNPASGMAIGNYADWMAQKVYLGIGASALALSFGGVWFPGWTVDHKLTGITHALWDLRFDSKGDHFGAGVPEPEWIGKWVKVYDPRKDSTYPGGSGAHRALDESTYEWSRNPALHALTWCLGRWQNDKRTIGLGAPIENIRVADFVEAANVADANGWTLGGVEWSTDAPGATLKRMLQAAGAEVTMTGAMIGCRVFMPRVSIATVTTLDIIDSFSMPTTRPRAARFNTVIPRYVSENHDWAVISGSPVSVPLYVTEDGGPRTKEIDFPLVQAEQDSGVDGEKQAGELAAYEIVNSREAGPWSLTVGWKYVGIKTGDCITIDIPEESIDAQPVIVRKRSIDPATFKITFEVETETDEKHDFALGKTTTPPPSYTPTPPDLTPPTPNAALWDMTPGYAGLGSPAITIAGVCEFPGADAVLIEYRKLGDTDWLSLGKLEASAPIKRVISPLEGGVPYDARVAYQSGNRIGPWLDLDQVSTPFTLNLDPRLDPPIVYVTADETGSVVDYSGATGSFVIPMIDGIDLSENFTLSTAPGGDPFDLVESYDDQTFEVTGGISAAHAEDTTKLTIRASGTGFYSGIVIDRTLTIVKNYSVTLTDVAENFNARNDRNGDPIPACVFPLTGAIDATPNDDGSVDISFEWIFPGDTDTIDRYEVEFYSSNTSSPHTPGTTPAFRIQIEPDVPAIILHGVSATLYYTPAVRAVRVVDPDIDPSRRIYGDWAKVEDLGFNPFRPQSQPFFLGTIGESIGGVAATVVAATIDPVDGHITDGRVITSSIGTNAVTQTIDAIDDLNLSLGSGIGTDMRCLLWVNVSPEAGEEVHLFAEIVTNVSFIIAGQPAGTAFSAKFALTRGPQSLAITTGGGGTSYDDYLAAGGEAIVEPYEGKVFTYNVGGNASYRSEDAPVPISHVDDDFDPGPLRYGMWMGPGTADSTANTRTRQRLQAQRVKR